MDELYFTHNEALDLANSFAHLRDTTFTDPVSGMTYTTLAIMPIPADTDKQNILKDLMTTFIADKGSNKKELDIFQARARDDHFTVALFGISFPQGGANLLLILMSRFANPDGSLRYGFLIDESHSLF